MQTPNSNLVKINTAFQGHCYPLLMEFSTSVAVLCDFPSKLSPPTPHFKIFGLDNFNEFLEASASPSVLHVIVFDSTNIYPSEVAISSPSAR